MAQAQVLPDTATHRNRRKVTSIISGREYTVSQRISTGIWECSCLGWTTHRKCKHVPQPQARMHWMCNGCQLAHKPAFTTLDPRLRNRELGICCWCGKMRTTLAAPPGVTMPCEDIHLEDV